MGKSNKEFTDWRQAEADKMPALAARVFALRNKMYTGCGFHWGMERDLGVIIARLNDYDTDYYHGTEALARQIGLEVHLEQLYKHVEQAEKSAEEWEREKKRKDPKKTKYILTSEDWYPTRNGKVKVIWTPLRTDPVLFRVAVWGNDDFGLELDTPDQAKSEEIYNKIKDHTTQAELKGMGFQHA